MHLTDHYTWRSVIKCVKHRVWGHAPPFPGKFAISDLLRLFLVLFWGEIGRVGRPTAKSSDCL